EALGLLACRAALHVDDLAVAKREHLVPLVAAPAVEPTGRADDHVVADACELGLCHDSAAAVFADLEGQDLTGLVGPASGRCVLPRQVAARDATPFALVCDELGEGLGVTPVEGVRRGTELVDHSRIIARFLAAGGPRASDTRPSRAARCGRSG